MYYGLIASICCPILRLCSCCDWRRENRLPNRQCTIQRQSGSPQESHLISSSLHVINLPAQCYCIAGHSSSFRDRGIDQARTASVVHLCVLWANSKEWTVDTILPLFFFSLHYVFVQYMYACLVNVCIFKCQKQQQNRYSMHMYSHIFLWVGPFPYWRLVVWRRESYSPLITITSFVRHPCLVAHIKKTGTKDKQSIGN